MTAALEGGECSAAHPGRTLPPGKTRYPLHRRLGGPQGSSGRAENLVPTGIRSRTVHPAVTRYTNWATGPTLKVIYVSTIKQVTSFQNYFSKFCFGFRNDRVKIYFLISNVSAGNMLVVRESRVGGSCTEGRIQSECVREMDTENNILILETLTAAEEDRKMGSNMFCAHQIFVRTNHISVEY
jgi:hypothetical protein